VKFPRTLNFNPTSAQFILLSSLFIAAIFNIPFLSAVYEVVAPVTLNEWVFFLSVPLLLTFFNIIFLSLFGALFLPRTTVAIAFVVSSILLLHTPEQTGHRFRLYPDTLSVLIRTPIPG
jgi:lipid A ethanolaminephosphotransferase